MRLFLKHLFQIFYFKKVLDRELPNHCFGKDKWITSLSYLQDKTLLLQYLIKVITCTIAFVRIAEIVLIYL